MHVTQESIQESVPGLTGQMRRRTNGYIQFEEAPKAPEAPQINEVDSGSWEKRRSKQVFQVAQYNWIVLPTIMVLVHGAAYNYLKAENGGSVIIDDSRLWTTEALLFMVLVFPSQVFWILGFLGSLFPSKPFHNAQQPVQRDFDRLLICLVTRGDQEDIVRRSITSMQDICQRRSERVSLHVVTEERNAGRFAGLFRDHVRIHAVPAAFRARKARYKARSLEWFRRNLPVRDEDWVLHLDEETIVDEYAIDACLDFMTRQTVADVGTGIVHYNSDANAYWGNTLTTIGDVGRVQQDWGRLQFQANWMHNAALGIHGSFLLVRGAAENAATWETDVLTEDYWFLLQAMRNGYRIGWVPAIAREISPATVADYIRQRKRWFSGIRQINQTTGRLVLLSWMWILLEPVYWFISWYTDLGSSPKPRWFFMLLVFEMTYDKVHMCALCLLQDWDAGYSWPRMIWSQILMMTMGPLVHFADTLAVVTALWSPDKDFYIIQKK